MYESVVNEEAPKEADKNLNTITTHKRGSDMYAELNSLSGNIKWDDKLNSLSIYQCCKRLLKSIETVNGQLRQGER